MSKKNPKHKIQTGPNKSIVVGVKRRRLIGPITARQFVNVAVALLLAAVIILGVYFVAGKFITKTPSKNGPNGSIPAPPAPNQDETKSEKQKKDADKEKTKPDSLFKTNVVPYSG